MAHFAKVENNLVTDVIVIDNEYESNGQQFINEVLQLEGTWIQTSYNNNIRGTFAGRGFTYDPVNDVFVAPPVPEFVKNVLDEL